MKPKGSRDKDAVNMCEDERGKVGNRVEQTS